MNKALISIIILVIPCLLRADIDDNSFSAESIAPKNYEEGNPFKIKCTGDYVSRAKLHRDHLHHQRLIFSEFEIEAGFLFYYNAECEEALETSLSYSRTRIDWNHNPYFHKTEFNTASWMLAGISRRISDWLWRAQVTINLDTDHPNLGRYGTYDCLFWGRYDYRENIGLHIGLLTQTGMNIERIYPIIGFDWTFNETWKLNLVFPVNLSLVYTYNPCWTVSLAARVFDIRHRADKHSNLSDAIVTYRTAGAECVVAYMGCSWFSANIHAGYTLGGTLTIANRNYHHKHHMRFDGSPYIGAEATVNF